MFDYSSETIHIRKKGSIFSSQRLSVERKIYRNSLSCKIIPQKGRTNRDFSRQTKIEETCYQQIDLVRNKGNSSKRRKMILNPSKEKRIRGRINRSERKHFFSFIIDLAGISLFKTIIATMFKMIMACMCAKLLHSCPTL